MSANRPATREGIAAAVALWEYTEGILAALPSTLPYLWSLDDKNPSVDEVAYRAAIAPLGQRVSREEISPDACVFVEGQRGLEPKSLHPDLWGLVNWLRNQKFRPTSDELALWVRKRLRLPDTGAAPIEAQNLVAAPQEYQQRTAEFEAREYPSLPSTAACALPPMEHDSPYPDRAIEGIGDELNRPWFREFAETVAIGDPALDSILLRPLLAQKSDDAARRAIAAIRRGRSIAAEERRQRAEHEREKKSGTVERVEGIGGAMARIYQMRDESLKARETEQGRTVFESVKQQQEQAA